MPAGEVAMESVQEEAGRLQELAEMEKGKKTTTSQPNRDMKRAQKNRGLWSLETKGNAALLGFSGSASVASPTEVFSIACHLRAFLTADAGKMSRTCSPAELPSKSEIKIEVWMVIPPIFSHTHAVVNHETQTLFSLSIWCKSCL